MRFFTTTLNSVTLIVFTSSVLFADVQSIEPSILHNTKEEVLEEEIGPPPPPSALIDLNQDKKEKKKGPKRASMYLFLFNIAMFTTGMIVVKTINGKKV